MGWEVGWEMGWVLEGAVGFSYWVRGCESVCARACLALLNVIEKYKPRLFFFISPSLLDFSRFHPISQVHLGGLRGTSQRRGEEGRGFVRDFLCAYSQPRV